MVDVSRFLAAFKAQQGVERNHEIPATVKLDGVVIQNGALAWRALKQTVRDFSRSSHRNIADYVKRRVCAATVNVVHGPGGLSRGGPPFPAS